MTAEFAAFFYRCFLMIGRFVLLRRTELSLPNWLKPSTNPGSAACGFGWQAQRKAQHKSSAMKAYLFPFMMMGPSLFIGKRCICS